MTVQENEDTKSSIKDSGGLGVLLAILFLGMLLQPAVTGLLALLFGLPIPIDGSRSNLMKVFTDWTTIAAVAEIFMWPYTWGLVVLAAVFFRPPRRFAIVSAVYISGHSALLLYFLYSNPKPVISNIDIVFMLAHPLVVATAATVWLIWKSGGKEPNA